MEDSKKQTTEGGLLSEGSGSTDVESGQEKGSHFKLWHLVVLLLLVATAITVPIVGMTQDNPFLLSTTANKSDTHDH